MAAVAVCSAVKRNLWRMVQLQKKKKNLTAFQCQRDLLKKLEKRTCSQEEEEEEHPKSEKP
jgi:hypothetical protein